MLVGIICFESKPLWFATSPGSLNAFNEGKCTTYANLPADRQDVMNKKKETNISAVTKGSCSLIKMLQLVFTITLPGEHFINEEELEDQRNEATHMKLYNW